MGGRWGPARRISTPGRLPFSARWAGIARRRECPARCWCPVGAVLGRGSRVTRLRVRFAAQFAATGRHLCRAQSACAPVALLTQSEQVAAICARIRFGASPERSVEPIALGEPDMESVTQPRRSPHRLDNDTAPVLRRRLLRAARARPCPGLCTESRSRDRTTGDITLLAEMCDR